MHGADGMALAVNVFVVVVALVHHHSLLSCCLSVVMGSLPCRFYVHLLEPAQSLYVFSRSHVPF